MGIVAYVKPVAVNSIVPSLPMSTATEPYVPENGPPAECVHVQRRRSTAGGLAVNARTVWQDVLLLPLENGGYVFANAVDDSEIE